MRNYKVTGTNHFPEPYEPGNYVLGLHQVFNWYDLLVMGKGVTLEESNREMVFKMLVDKIFGDEDYDENKLDLLLNLDCIASREAVIVKTKLETMILNQVIGHFPKIGAFLPKNMYLLNGKDLIIDVPIHYEEQRGTLI